MFGEVLMDERFESLRPGAIKEAVNGAFREMHAQPASADDNLGGWNCRAGGWGLKADAFEMVETPDARVIEGTATANCADNAMLAKGDVDWRDVRVESRMMLLPAGAGWGGPAGVIFRFLDSQRYAAAVVDADGLAKIILRVGGGWDVLAAAPVEVTLNEWFDVRVEVRGTRAAARIGRAELAADLSAYPSGCVGFLAARPARFGPIRVTALGAEAERLADLKRRRAKRLTGKRKAFPRPVVWRQYDTRGFGTGRRIRLGDLTGDGRTDFLLIRLAGKHKHGVGSLTAMSADGDVLWRSGQADPPANETSGDGAVQIHDVDGDGHNEVIVAWEGQFQVLDGQTGQLKAAAPLPAMKPISDDFKGSVNHWGGGYNDDGPTVVPSSICFADLAGRGAPRDVLLADNYHTLVALTSEFDELWRTVCSHGHFPAAYDFDGDGRDSVLAGYQHLGPDGELIGRVCLTDHQDAIYAGPLDADGPAKVVMAGGEDGLLMLTPEYDIRQRIMGHVQRLAVGPFRADTPGLCIATVLFHGSPGIVSLFDSTGKRLWTRDGPVVGATLQPVNWDGSGTELMLLSGIRPSQGAAGGLIDGDGDLVVPLPDDGGPGFAAFACDLDGDGLDELMLWDYERIWIYHADADPPAGRTYRPVRPPLWNSSNFQSYWSRPRWQ